MKKILLAAVGAIVVATPAAAAPTLWAGNGHYYEFFGDQVDWTTARSAALASNYMGHQGYLVTITSASENSFLTSVTGSSLAWTGGNDADTEGTWVWADGPEAGQAFWINGVTQTYANWNGGEPNNVGNEDYLHFNHNQPGGWNDVPNGFQNGYVIEYGGLAVGVPEPSAWALLILGFGVVGGALRARTSTQGRRNSPVSA